MNIAYLDMYIESKNKWRRVFNQPELVRATLTPKQARDLLDEIECDLSPENLTCDGELRGAALIKKTKMLRGALAALENGEY